MGSALLCDRLLLPSRCDEDEGYEEGVDPLGVALSHPSESDAAEELAAVADEREEVERFLARWSKSSREH